MALPPPTTALMVVEPTRVRVLPVPTNVVVAYQRAMSKAVWRPAPGRKLGFLVVQDGHLLGLAFLASPVINLGPRDTYLHLPREGRGQVLRHYADLSVCVGAQPLAWYWNLGKLVATVATTLGDYWQERYGDELRGIVTTSLWGRGTQYNRLYRYLGLTKGFGHEHISDNRYAAMLRWMRERGVAVPGTRFGEGANARMRRIQAYRRASGDLAAGTFHGRQRGVYYHAAEPAHQRSAVIQWWYDRWGRPRYERTKDLQAPYSTGLQ